MSSLAGAALASLAGAAFASLAGAAAFLASTGLTTFSAGISSIWPTRTTSLESLFISLRARMVIPFS